MKDTSEQYQRCAREVMQRADDLAVHTERTYLTPMHHAAAQQLSTWMTEAGMQVRRDDAGNVIGRYEAEAGSPLGAPALVTGSHFDTVRNAGKYDGNLGILLPISCIAAWHRMGKRFPFPIEVIGFAEEEGVRFKATLLGSRAIAGTFDGKVLANLDEHGNSMRQVMQEE
jgi:acetylornithine deacetylase/succinyl-diaminopimelate desuccinylase-like protein